MKTDNRPFLFSERCLVQASLFLAVLALATSARGDPFYLRYDADEVYPEQAGWTRYGQDPFGAEKRSLTDGCLTLDTRGSYDIFDFYYVRSAALDLQPREELRVAWRMRTLQTDALELKSDASMFISNAQSAYVKLYLAPTFVSDWGWGMDGPEHLLALAPDRPHDYLFVSADMQHYDFFVDQCLVFSGEFVHNGLIGPRVVAWGDSALGMTSLSVWDYVEARVTPESASIVPAFAAFSFWVLGRRRCL